MTTLQECLEQTKKYGITDPDARNRICSGIVDEGTTSTNQKLRQQIQNQNQKQSQLMKLKQQQQKQYEKPHGMTNPAMQQRQAFEKQRRKEAEVNALRNHPSISSLPEPLKTQTAKTIRRAMKLNESYKNNNKSKSGGSGTYPITDKDTVDKSYTDAPQANPNAKNIKLPDPSDYPTTAECVADMRESFGLSNDDSVTYCTTTGRRAPPSIDDKALAGASCSNSTRSASLDIFRARDCLFNEQNDMLVVPTTTTSSRKVRSASAPHAESNGSSSGHDFKKIVRHQQLYKSGLVGVDNITSLGQPRSASNNKGLLMSASSSASIVPTTNNNNAISNASSSSSSSSPAIFRTRLYRFGSGGFF